MAKVFWLLAGIAAGFAAAHFVSRTPQGRALLDDIDERISGFGAAVVDGYRVREAELRSALDDAADAIDDLTERLD